MRDSTRSEHVRGFTRFFSGSEQGTRYLAWTSVRQPSKLSFCMTPREINNICVPHPNCPKPDPERRGSCHETISIARHAPRIMCRTSRVQVGSGRSVVGTWMETTYLQGMAYELARELISSRIGSLSSEIGVEEPR